MLIHIQDDIVRLQHSGLLDRLLKDKTTKNNIMWATDAYAHYGHEYERNEEIRPHLITGENVDIIKTRARKEFEQQNQRTRKRAEVFTPMWICRMMNDKLDEEWFGYPDVFFKEDKPIEEVRFFEKKRTWQDYVDSRRLEITCGEAPYLMSRYDVATGEIVPLEKRCGIFDRKLRVVSENASTEDEWFKWAIRAVQATYGYEFQGDNVLIARINILCTFEDYLVERWNRKLTRQETENIINIITWNIWQMDGLTYTIPFREAEPDFVQLSLFNDFEVDLTKVAQPLCRVYDWRRDNSGTFEGIKKGENRMKFDFIIGNPPYQEEVKNKGDRPNPIYDKFMDESFDIADCVEMIHPARFLFNAGQTAKAWNKKMLSDNHFKVLYYNPDASQVFPNTDIKGGVAITIRDRNKETTPIGTFTAYEELNTIIRKVSNEGTENVGLNTIIASQGLYRFSNKALLEHPEIEYATGSGTGVKIVSKILDKLPNVFLDEKADNEEYIRILGRVDKKRTYKLIKREYLMDNPFIDTFNLFIPEANNSGKYGETLTEPIIGHPKEGTADTFLSAGLFDSENEAINLSTYIKSKFFRALLGVKKVTHHCTPSVFSHIPLQDFTSNSDIDWSKSVAEIDRQLYAKYGLDETEIEFIESHVKEME